MDHTPTTTLFPVSARINPNNQQGQLLAFFEAEAFTNATGISNLKLLFWAFV
jgi:hypothetical protein